MIRCSTCILPETYPGIRFDADGQCNYCRAAHPRAPLGTEALERFVATYRGRGRPYDALVCLSGGRDSTYTLWYAVRQLGLHVLAYTVDHGLLAPETLDNIQRAVERLGVDSIIRTHAHLRAHFPAMLAAWLARPTPAMISALCLGCRYGIKKYCTGAFRHYRTTLVFMGDGEPETSFASTLFTRRQGFLPRVCGLAVGVGRELLRHPRYLSPARLALMAGEMYHYFISPRLREYTQADIGIVGLFEYLPWDEGEITRVITREAGWRQWSGARSAWRSDCPIALLKNILYLRTLGFTKNDELISGLIRRGMLTRDAGLQRVAYENVYPEEDVRALGAQLGLPAPLVDRLADFATTERSAVMTG